ncbi:hypothetical protein OROMI_014125 [Orobanche minor]
MDKCRQKHPKTQNCCCSEEVRSNGCEFIHMTEQEEDIICRMHKLVGNQWPLIAGRIPGRTPEEIQRFWKMRKSDSFKGKSIENEKKIRQYS